MDPKERPLVFGGGRLLGVLSEPATPINSPAILVLNSGLLPRVGPARLSVEFARAAARMGFAALRFDLSGLGDSEPRPGGLSPVQSAIADAREAMDAIGAELGVERFVLLGLCSGAVHGHHIATADARIVGAIMLDGYVFHTVRSRVTWSMLRLLPVRSLPTRALRWGRRRLWASRLPVPAREEDGFIPPWPPTSQVEADLRQLRSRGVALLLVFSGEWASYCYEGQMNAAYRSVQYGELLTEVRIPTAEHLYFTRPERDALLDKLQCWLAEQPWDRTTS